jgi:hypothetical protein
MGSEIRELGREAAQANVTLYALHMDSCFIDAFATKRGITPTLLATPIHWRRARRRPAALQAERSSACQASNGDSAFARVLRENSAHHLLAVEVMPSDRDGAAHAIRFRVNKRGTTVRSGCNCHRATTSQRARVSACRSVEWLLARSGLRPVGIADAVPQSRDADQRCAS